MQGSAVSARRGRGRTVRHVLLAQRRRRLAIAFTGLLLFAVVACVALMLTTPSTVVWPNAHVLRTAGIEVTTLWEKSAADALTMGTSTLSLDDHHIAAWLNQLVGADIADPAVAVACAQSGITLYYRLRLPFDLRAVSVLDLVPAVGNGALICTIRRSSIGRLPIPLGLWQRFVTPVDQGTGPGWVETAHGLVYAWPALLRGAAGMVAVDAVSVAPGTLHLLLKGAPE